MEYTEEQAFLDFEAWYGRCLENGIEPEKVVEQMGEMKLVTITEED